MTKHFAVQHHMQKAVAYFFCNQHCWIHGAGPQPCHKSNIPLVDVSLALSPTGFRRREVPRRAQGR